MENPLWAWVYPQLWFQIAALVSAISCGQVWQLWVRHFVTCVGRSGGDDEGENPEQPVGPAAATSRVSGCNYVAGSCWRWLCCWWCCWWWGWWWRGCKHYLLLSCVVQQPGCSVGPQLLLLLLLLLLLWCCVTLLLSLSWIGVRSCWEGRMWFRILS